MMQNGRITTKDKDEIYIYRHIDKRILSTSCHRSYCITTFFHELNTLDACWIAVDVWSRQESVYQGEFLGGNTDEVPAAIKENFWRRCRGGSST